MSIIEFEAKVIAIAKAKYPGVSSFPARLLDPIRKELKGFDEATTPKTEPKAPDVSSPAPAKRGRPVSKKK